MEIAQWQEKSHLPRKSSSFVAKLMYILVFLVFVLGCIYIYNPAMVLFLYNPSDMSFYNPFKDDRVHIDGRKRSNGNHSMRVSELKRGNVVKNHDSSAYFSLRKPEFNEIFKPNETQIYKVFNASASVHVNVTKRLAANAYEATSVLQEFNRTPAFFEPAPRVDSFLLEPSEGVLTSQDGWDTPMDHMKDGPYFYNEIDTTHSVTDGHIYIGQAISKPTDPPSNSFDNFDENVYYRPQRERFSPTPDSHRHHVHFGAAFTQWNISHARNVTQDFLSLVRHRYELDKLKGSQYFFTSNNIDTNTWDMMKYKFAKLMIGNIFLDRDDDFVMAFGGSNNTVGVRNYFHESYPMIVEKRLGPLLKAMGIRLVVHNIASRRATCSPYVLCYEAQGLVDPDVVGWEQGGECKEPSNDAAHEQVARIAGSSSRRGMVHFTSPAFWSTSNCPPSKEKIPYCSEDWTEESAGIKKWRASQGDLTSIREILGKYYSAKPSVEAYLQWTKNSTYRSIFGPHGFNDMERNYRCMRVNGTTGCSGREVLEDVCSLKFMSKEASIYSDDKSGSFSSKAMTRAFHLLRGEAMSWLYAMTFLDAIYMVESELKARVKSPSTLYTEYSQVLDRLIPPLDKFEPSRCASFHCESKMTCYTNYLPHYSKDQTLDEVIVGQTNWTYFSGKVTDDTKKYGYIDHKPAYYSLGMSDAGEIRIKAELGSSLYCWVCGENLQDKALFYLDANVLLYDEVSYHPVDNRIVWDRKLSPKGENCVELHGLPKGEHVLSITNKPTYPHARLSLTHVIFWS